MVREEGSHALEALEKAYQSLLMMGGLHGDTDDPSGNTMKALKAKLEETKDQLASMLGGVTVPLSPSSSFLSPRSPRLDRAHSTSSITTNSSSATTDIVGVGGSGRLSPKREPIIHNIAATSAAAVITAVSTSPATSGNNSEAEDDNMIGWENGTTPDRSEDAVVPLPLDPESLTLVQGEVTPHLAKKIREEASRRGPISLSPNCAGSEKVIGSLALVADCVSHLSATDCDALTTSCLQTLVESMLLLCIYI